MLAVCIAMLDLTPFIRGRSGAAILVEFFASPNFLLRFKLSELLGDLAVIRRDVLSLLPRRELRLRRSFRPAYSDA